jgi:outer membrane protein OmpA-like peptidoglycan-associated protein
MKRNYAFTLVAGLSCALLSAQYNADFKVFKPQQSGAYSLEKLLQSMAGHGVVLKSYSITKTSSDEAFGFFEDKKARLGMKKGLVMTTGGIAGLSSKNLQTAMSNNTHANAEGRGGAMDNKTGCEDLEKLLDLNLKTYDACIIELDVVPTADTLCFNYVFGSEEYDEYVGSNYNDVFAFFISGKGIKNVQNLAVVPHTKIPVSVNSINNGGGYNSKAASNPAYYVSNIDGSVGLEYDGLTKLMEIKQAVTPYETYHIKLAIADVSDNAFDSGVLIEGRSIVSYEKKYKVLYDKNSNTIESGYQHMLDALADQYKNYGGKILVTGHTDNEGGEDATQELSCNRAYGVSAYLQSKGVKENNIIIDCKGQTMPANDNYNEAGKILNRRVELKITGDNTIYYDKKNTGSAVGLVQEKSALIKNFPNPFIGSTTIEANILIGVKEAYLLITDMTGRTIKQIYLVERGNTSAIFDAGNLAEGIYNVTLFTDGAVTGNLKMVNGK